MNDTCNVAVILINLTSQSIPTQELEKLFPNHCSKCAQQIQLNNNWKIFICIVLGHWKTFVQGMCFKRLYLEEQRSLRI